MSWRPTYRIVYPEGYTNSRGLNPLSSLSWPGSNVGGGADYSVDFSGMIPPNETIVSFAFDTGSFGTQAWTWPNGTVCTAWISWTQSGVNVVTVCALCDSGATYQVEVSISVSASPSLIPASPPTAPGKLVVGVTDTSMSAWLASLPTSPPSGGGWWNNSNIPTFAGTPT